MACESWMPQERLQQRGVSAGSSLTALLVSAFRLSAWDFASSDGRSGQQLAVRSFLRTMFRDVAQSGAPCDLPGSHACTWSIKRQNHHHHRTTTAHHHRATTTTAGVSAHFFVAQHVAATSGRTRARVHVNGHPRCSLEASPAQAAAALAPRAAVTSHRPG